MSQSGDSPTSGASPLPGTKADSKPQRVLLWFEANRGEGHIQAVSQVARELRAKGCEVLVVTGSHQAFSGRYDFGEGTKTLRLPGFIDNPSFLAAESATSAVNQQLTVNEKEIADDSEWHRIRTDLLLSAYKQFKPDVMLAEMWPIQRNNHDRELTALMDLVKQEPPQNKPKLFCLVRDVILSGERDPFRNTYSKSRSVSMLRKYLDGNILVYGDKNVIDFDKGWGVIPNDIKAKIQHIGYFMPESAKALAEVPKDGPIVVSSGGSVTEEGMMLFKAAMQARSRSSYLHSHPMRLFVPLDTEDMRFIELMRFRDAQPDKDMISLESTRQHASSNEFKMALAKAPLSISHGGITPTEAVVAKVPTIALPRFLNASNYEQFLRTKALADKGFIEMVNIDRDSFTLEHATQQILECSDKIQGTIRINTRGSLDIPASSLPTHYFNDRPELHINGAVNVAEVLSSAQRGASAGVGSHSAAASLRGASQSGHSGP